ncbi:Head fiber protein [Tissierella creatinophila]|uniref:Head fiber protein n=1 Tax=Tissierella creatinophila DSM 6911 TaxID=1123403 RepID=A0A1U7M5U2_TISCR|nr:Head fiber protein [Tissierella creatinophila]OLS02558.1 hypothetical protein TICRE_13590 [Tissierella creatinophila DSM 6911]
MSNTKNYKKQGGDKWVVNGVLEVTESGLLLLNNKPLTRSQGQAESTASTISDLKEDFNSLLEKLKHAGLMETE